MSDQIVSASARPARIAIVAASLASLAVVTTALGVAAFGVSNAQAQAPATPSTPPAAPRPAAPRPAAPARPATPPAAKPAPPAQAPAAQAPPAGQQQAQQPALPEIIYSPWLKICEKPEGAPKTVCVTFKDGRFESGQPVIMASVIEPEGEPKKILRIFLPLGFQLPFGTRLLVDQADLRSPFLYCVQPGCVTDYEVTPDLLAKLKKAPQLVMQVVNLAGYSMSFPLPLADFGKANDGPPTDPKVAQEQQRKLQEELQKRADEARKRLEGTPGAAAGTPPPAR